MIFMPRFWAGLILLAVAGTVSAKSSTPDLDAARQALERGDGIAAEVALKRALASGAQPQAVAAGMGEAWLLQGDRKRAREWLGKGEFAPGTVAEGYRALGLLEHSEGNLPEAGRAFDRALALAPNDSQLWVDIGRLRYSGGEQIQAIEAADKAVKFETVNTRALEFRGQLVRDQYGPAAALPWFEEAVSKSPNDLELLGEYAATLGEAGRNADMLVIARKMIELSPDHPRALYLQAVLAARAGQYGIAKSIFGRVKGRILDVPAVMLFAGCMELEAGNSSTAIDILSRLLRQQPANQRAQDLLARAYAEAGRSSELIHDFADLARRPGASPYLMTRVAWAYEDLGQRDLAAPLLDRAAQNQPEIAPIYEFAVDNPSEDAAAQIRRLLAGGNAGAASAIAERQVAMRPGFAAAHSLAGDALMMSGKPDDAARHYGRAALVRFNNDLLLRMLLATSRTNQRDQLGPIVANFLNGNPRDPIAARIAASQAASLGNWGLSRGFLEVLRARGQGRDARLLCDLSYAQLRDGDRRAALETAEAAYRLQPSSPVAAQAYGIALAENREKPRSARSLLRKAKAVGGGNPLIDHALSQVPAS
jgi:tetratricopeptide (TPR) repeat protein